MNCEQYEFSNIFWSDEEWDKSQGIPKYFTINDKGEIEFHFLDENETKEFLKIKTSEDPKLLKKFRTKKLKRLL